MANSEAEKSGCAIRESLVEGLGSSLFLTRSVKKGDIIGPYFGIFMSKAEVEASSSDRIVHLQEASECAAECPDVYLDGAFQCFTTYVNDPDHGRPKDLGKRANCELVEDPNQLLMDPFYLTLRALEVLRLGFCPLLYTPALCRANLQKPNPPP